jgi:smad nuclear-interacting protein 1
MPDVDAAIMRKTVKPYILDLDSTNKTYLNGTAIEGSRYVELKAKDILKFGESTKEYVLICE